MPTIAITVKGDVQGVFFRQSTRELAEVLGIKGYVENKPGGDVYIVATGPKENLDKLVAWTKQGPPKARVDDVLVDSLPDQQFEGFSIHRH